MSLSRLAGCNRQQQFLIDTPNWFIIHIYIVSNLDPAESLRFVRTCMALFVEQKDLFLSCTALRMQYSAPGFSVPTPPLAIDGEDNLDLSATSDDWEFAHLDVMQFDAEFIL